MPSLFLHRTTASRENVLIDGLWVTSIDRTLVDIAASASHLTAVAMLDHAMHAGLVTADSLLEELAYVAPGRGARRAAAAIYFADPKSESPGESLSRVRFWQLGFEAPELQVEFREASGFRAVVDFAWSAGRIVGEFDGYDKYVNPAFARGRSTAQLVLDEKSREDRIRPMVDRFVRWGWDLALDGKRFGTFLAAHHIPLRRSATFR